MKKYDYLDNKILEEIVEVLDNDGLIIFPTDTVYGIACNSFSDKAIKKLYEAKKRDYNKPIGVLTDSIDKINKVVDSITTKEKELIYIYFPGNLTIIFNKNKNVSNLLTANENTIGVRIPNNKIALEILKHYPYPLATTSVNISGSKEGTEVSDFIDEFKNKVDIIIDNGKTSELPSTIVRVEDDNIKVLREGSLKIEDNNIFKVGERMNELEYTKNYYNKEENIKRYGEGIKIGLWNSESIFFEKYLKKDNYILDLGCGAGRTTFGLYKLGYKNIIGVDIAENLVDYAKKYSNDKNIRIDFEVGDATQLRFADNTFDAVIFSYNGMQCIPGEENRKKVLKEVYRVLKPNGYYIFTAHDRHDPKSSHLEFWHDIETKWEKGINEKNVECLGDLFTTDQAGIETFIHFSTIEELEEFICEQSFEIIEHTHSYDIADESEETRKFAGDTVFWSVKKK